MTRRTNYFPIPYYASLLDKYGCTRQFGSKLSLHSFAWIFKGKWYSSKQLIGVAKDAKLRNSAPLKYHIEVSNKFWGSIFRAEGITDRKKQQERVVKEKLKPYLDSTGQWGL